jgi:hypothetical protein
MDTNRDASKNIDWLRVFENLDIDQDLFIEVYETTNDTQKHDYYNKASFKLTLQFLLQFKKETQFHSIERKLQYIKSLNIKPPKQSLTESPLFDQTTFNAKRNYYEFIQEYTSYIEKELGLGILDQKRNLIWWKKSKEMLQCLMNELHSMGYTDSSSLDNFMDKNRQPFLGKNIQKSIWWKKTGRLLKYLMDELARLDYIDQESPVNKHIKEHFIDKNKYPFTDSIKQNSSGAGLNKSGKPKGHEEVDSLINSLKDQQDQSE